MRFQIIQRTCQAGTNRGGKYRRPVVLRIVDTASGPGDYYWVRWGCVREVSNLDSRYDGPNSEYGRYKRELAAECARLNAEISSNEIVPLLRGAAPVPATLNLWRKVNYCIQG